MGYFPFEHWLGRTRRLGAHGVRARGWALGADGRWGAQAGAGALGRGRVGVRGSRVRQERTGRAVGRLGRVGRVRQGRAGSWARAQGLGAWPVCTWARWLGCGLCTWCTQPVLTQFRLNTVLE